MKISLRITLALAACLSVRLAAEQPPPPSLADQLAPQSFSKNPSLDMVVVAETTAAGAKLVHLTTDQSVDYVAFDGGYREAGDPVANEKPPTAAAVARALRQTLAAAGYRPATDQTPPTLLLVYHWGSLNRDSQAIHSGMDLDPNLKARVALVAGRRYEREIDDEIIQRQISREMHTSFPSARFLSDQARQLGELAQDNRYFVIVSAYDYAALRRHEAQLLWRAKMSASSAGAAMAGALPALIQGGGPYFGRDHDESQFVRTPLGPGAKVETGSSAEPKASDLTGATGRLDDPFVRELAEKEGAEVTGARWHAASNER
jgi:hypothetical protein